MKRLLFSILCISCLLVHAQDKESRKKIRKWYATPEIDFGFVNRKMYTHSNDRGGLTFEDIQAGGLSLESFAASYGWHYIFFSKLSFGFVGGVQTFSNLGYTMFNVGTRLQYFFADRDNVHLFLYLNYGSPSDTKDFVSGGGLGIGLGFPVLKRKDFNIIAALYFERNGFTFNDSSRPILSNETPENLLLDIISLRFGYVSKKGRIKKKYRK